MNELHRLGFYLRNHQRQHGICSTGQKCINLVLGINLFPGYANFFRKWSDCLWEKEIFRENAWKKNPFQAQIFSILPHPTLSCPWICTPLPPCWTEPEVLEIIVLCFLFFRIQILLTLFTLAVRKEINGAGSSLSALAFLQHLIKWENYSLLHGPQIMNIIFLILCRIWIL